MKSQKSQGRTVKGLHNLNKLVGGGEEVQLDNELEINPIGAINAGEGLDMSIWKVTMDRKARTVAMISEELADYGFDRRAVKDQVIKLTNYKNWFDRSNRAGDIFYVLKKTIKMPGSEQKPEVDDGISIPAIDVNNYDLESVQKHHQLIHQLESQREEGGMEEVKPEVVKQEPVAEVSHVTSAIPPVAETLSAKDGVRTCIWKIMSDYQEYTLADVALLLGEIGIKYQTVASHISRLKLKAQWFDTHTNSKGAGVYVLRKHIPKPEGEAPYSPNVETTPTVQTGQVDLDLVASTTAVQEVLSNEPEVPHPDDIFATLAEADPAKVTAMAGHLELKHSNRVTGDMSDYISYRRDVDNLTEQVLINAKSRRVWEKESGYSKPEVEVEDTNHLQLPMYAAGMSSGQLEHYGLRGVLADMNANRIAAASVQVRNPPVRAYGESEIRIPVQYAGLMEMLEKAAQKEPVVKEEPMDFDSELIKFVIRVGQQDLTPQQAVTVAKALVQQGYGPTRNAPVPKNTELVQFGAVIMGQPFNAEQTQEIACKLVEAGFTE